MVSRVFIGSSSEGRDVVDKLETALRLQLKDEVVLHPWTRSFELGDTTIETLEAMGNAADFAILVLTADDDVTKRSEQGKAPRDNVVFELGLFIGCIGRQRSFFLQQADPLLQVPSDLLAVNTLRFSRPGGGADWDTALVARIAERIRELGPRERVAPEFAQAQHETRAFARIIEGWWWERIALPQGKPWLSYFRIDFDGRRHTLSFLGGRGYDSEGVHGSDWESPAVWVSPEQARVDYQWEGRYINHRTRDRFHGRGAITFERPSGLDSRCSRARGEFWDVDEAVPENTTVKPVEMKRASEEQIETMHAGPEKSRSALVLRVLGEW